MYQIYPGLPAEKSNIGVESQLRRAIIYKFSHTFLYKINFTGMFRAKDFDSDLPKPQSRIFTCTKCSGRTAK